MTNHEWKLLTHPLLMPYEGESCRPVPTQYYKVLYRAGTVRSYKWREHHGEHSIRKATEIREMLARQGFRTQLIPEGVFKAKGLPTTFNAHDHYKEAP